jgi:fatty-acyl-CoA synthase
MLEHPAVAEVAVVGLPDHKWGEIIACFIRPGIGQELDAGELRSFCRQQLSPQKTPSVWCRVGAFPLTGSGKVQKYILRDRYLAGDFTPL